MQLKLKKLEAVESGATWDNLSTVKKISHNWERWLNSF